MGSKCPKCSSKNIERIKKQQHMLWMTQDTQRKLMEGWEYSDPHYVCHNCGRHFRNAWG